MDFQSVNPLNVRLNLLSGNLFPMTSYDSSFPLFWKLYSIFVWMIELTVAIVMIPGCMYVSTEKILKDGTICFAVSIEMIFMIVRIHASKDLVRQLIQKFNEILRADDETIKNLVIEILKPLETPLNFYWIAGTISIIAWGSVPFVLIFEKNLFYYEDYKIPAVFSRQPFSLRTFLLGNIFLTISCVYMFLKKVGVDVYMVHLVMIMTAQYQYIALKMVTIFQKEGIECNESKEKDFSGLHSKREREMKELCRYHNRVIHMTSLLKKLLSLNCSVIYVSSVFRFCGIALTSTMSSATIWEKIAFFLYALGAIIQLYILCSCVQQLLDASTEITDKAFHEDWYLLEPSIKSTFRLMIMANNLKCKLAAFKNFNLSLPSFMTILNQSYSVTLLLLKMKN